MGTDKIKRKIEVAINDEEQTGRLAENVKSVARQNGVNLNKEQVDNIIDFIEGYVQHIPYYIDTALALSKDTGIKGEITQMVQELEAYWAEDNDVIPDHLGLLGVMDDAYASMLLLQSVSDYCKQTSGTALLAQDWHQANRSIHNLIGEPAASIIDQKVNVTITQSLMGSVMNSILTSGFTFRSPDPISSIDQIVDTRLGAMGVV